MQDVSKRGNPPAPIEGTNQNFFLPGEEGERRDVRGLLCVGAFLVFVVRGRAVVAAEGEGRREACEAAARCGGELGAAGDAGCTRVIPGKYSGLSPFITAN